MGWKIMTFLETVEKNKENFIKEEGKKYNKKITLETKDLKKYWDSLSEKEKIEYETEEAWYPFLTNYLSDTQHIDFLKDVEFDYDELI